MGKYDELSKEELVALLTKRDAERKFGLVWERDHIEHDRALNDDYVFMDFDPELSEGSGPYENLVVEGDNFDTLRYLNLTHRGKIKCIYIDPPYNTGENDWVYNDRFVDKDHSFRHSMWLEFMHRRLLLARDLLREDGVVYISIDDNEMHHLRMICDQVFPGMFVGVFVWKRRTGANDEKNWFLSVDHEYVLCYANPGFFFEGVAKDSSNYKNPDNDPRGPWTRGDLTSNKNRIQRPNTYYPIQNPDNGIWYPCDQGAVWRFASIDKGADEESLRSYSIETLLAKKKILFPSDDKTVIYDTLNELLSAIEEGSAPAVLKTDMPDLEFFVGKRIGYGRPGYKRHLSEVKSDYKPFSTWIKPSSDDSNIYEESESQHIESGLTTEGTRELKKVFGGQKLFQHPKPPSLIKGLVSQSTKPLNGDIVLDFFAGSGTTGDMVLRLNAEDGGNRRFIMASSTEKSPKEPDKNVCRDVTAQRVRNVIRGYNYMTTGKSAKRISIAGIGGSFAYLRAGRIEQEDVYISLQHDQVWHALQLIHFDLITPTEEEGKVLHVFEDNYKRVVYIPEINEKALLELSGILTSDSKTTIVYAWQPAIVKERVFSEHMSVEQIPEYLMERFGGAL